MIFIPVFEEKTLIQSGDTNGNEVIHYPITKTECIDDLDVFLNDFFANSLSSDDIISGNSISDFSITESKLATSSVSTAKLATSSVTSDKLADGSVTEGKLGASSVTTAKIKDLAVTSDKLGASSVIEAKLGTSSVTTTKIKDLAVTSAKLGSSSVITAKIADGAVTSDKLSSDISFDSTKYATVVVGTTRCGHTLNDCDFLCTGSNDQDVINQAISSLTSYAGKVVILEGYYYLSDSVVVGDNYVTLVGMGAGTVFSRGSNSTGSYGISVSGAYCTINNICCIGAYAGIYLSGNYHTITNNYCNNNTMGIYSTSATHCIISCNQCNGNSLYSINLAGTSELMSPRNNTVVSNQAYNGINSLSSTNIIESNVTG